MQSQGNEGGLAMLGSRAARVSSTLATVSASRWSEQRRLHILLLTIDTIAIGTGFAIAYLLRFETNFSFFYEPVNSTTDLYRKLVLVLIPAWLTIFAVFKLYDLNFIFGGTQEYANLFNACTTGMMLVIVASFLYPELNIARGWLLLSWLSVTMMASVGRFTVRRLVYRLRARGRCLTAMIIVGADEEGKAIAEQIISNPTAGVWVAGFIDDTLPKDTEVVPGLRVLGSTNAARALVHNLGVQELLVSSSALSREKLLELFRTFGNSDNVNLRLSSGLFEIMTTGLCVKKIGEVPLLSVNRVRLTGADVVLKRILDYIGATLGLILLSPLFALIAIAIKHSSRGPVFYRRRVVGVGGKEFDAFKFRTMVIDADQVLEQNLELKAKFEKDFKLKNDPRVTTIGKLLRKTSLDELPQLVNVLRGEMSMVGPRMITSEEVAKYGKWRMNLLTVKPGITGLWQVSGRSNVSYTERVRFDMHYIRNYTVWLDLHVLFQTIPAVLRKEGAF
jgi:exopolysaccharide biosynthesis polyprenyl glycosylphosphotransferase